MLFVSTLLVALQLGAPPLEFENAEAKAAFNEASAAFATKDFDAASAALARAHALEPRPTLLYARAQAERLAGRCATASPLYLDFLQTDPEPATADLAQWNLSVCHATLSLDADECDQAQSQVDTLAEEATDKSRAEQLEQLESRLNECREATLAPETAPPPVVLVEPPPARVERQPPREDASRRDRRKRRGVDGPALGLGLGSLAAAGGSVALALRSSTELDARTLEGLHSRALEREQSSVRFQGAAIGVGAAAVGLATGAIVHWVLWRKRDRDKLNAAIR